MRNVTSVLGENSRERTDFEHAGFIPSRIELIDFPVVDAGVIPWLGFIVLALVLGFLLHGHLLAIALYLHRCGGKAIQETTVTSIRAGDLEFPIFWFWY